jgi:hypothetical protein
MKDERKRNQSNKFLLTKMNIMIQRQYFYNSIINERCGGLVSALFGSFMNFRSLREQQQCRTEARSTSYATVVVWFFSLSATLDPSLTLPCLGFFHTPFPIIFH